MRLAELVLFSSFVCLSGCGADKDAASDKPQNTHVAGTWWVNVASARTCWVQEPTESQMGPHLSGGPFTTRKAACESAKNNYDSTLTDQTKCWVYAPVTIDRCKLDGVNLPK